MLSPVWPLARLRRYSSLLLRAVEWPAYVRIIHGRSGCSSRWLTPGIMSEGAEPGAGAAEQPSTLDSRAGHPGIRCAMAAPAAPVPSRTAPAPVPRRRRIARWRPPVAVAAVVLGLV